MSGRYCFVCLDEHPVFLNEPCAIYIFDAIAILIGYIAIAFVDPDILESRDLTNRQKTI